MSDIFIDLPVFIRKAEEQGWVTRTFRRLDPERQNAVIIAIFEEAAETGPAEINIKEVAARCQVAVGSLYQYFGSRAQLVDFAIELMVHETTTSFESYTDYLSSLPLRAALEAYMGGGIEWTKERLGMARMFARAAYQGSPDMNERAVRPIAGVLTKMVRAILQAAQKRGEIREDIDLEAVTRLVNVQMIAIGDALLLTHLNEYYQLFDAELTVERIFNSFFQMLASGLMPRNEG
jgi:TetR/AcrR family transcriptional regulator